MYKKLIALADQLDAKNLPAEAGIIDSILQEACYRATDSAGGVPVVLQDGQYVKEKNKEDFQPLPWEEREEELKKQLAKQPLDKLKDLYEAIKKTVLGGVDSNKRFTFAAGQELMEYEPQLKLITTLLEEGKIEEVLKTLIRLPKNVGQFVLELIKNVATRKASLSKKADPTDNQPIRVE